MKWAFVDYENTGSLEAICLTDYERVFVFCGPNHKKINFGTLSNTSFCNIELLSIKTTGANNLDFHLSFYLGKFHEIADKKIEFHIVSNDNGFNGIIEHQNDLGRRCLKVTTKSPIKVVKNKLTANALLAISRLEQLKESKRPHKKDTFKNFIKSQCKTLKTNLQIKSVFDELISHKKIKVENSNVTYHIKEILKKNKHSSLSEGATSSLAGLKKIDGRKRPRKKDGLLNWINSKCGSILPKVNSEIIYNELFEARIITESNQRMSYHIKK